jgi:hypothetical protein
LIFAVLGKSPDADVSGDFFMTHNRVDRIFDPYEEKINAVSCRIDL